MKGDDERPQEGSQVGGSGEETLDATQSLKAIVPVGVWDIGRAVPVKLETEDNLSKYFAFPESYFC